MQAWKENKKPSPNFYAELQAVFFSAVLGCHHCDSLSLNLNKMFCYALNKLSRADWPHPSSLQVQT